jgi:WD40 repeat protein
VGRKVKRVRSVELSKLNVSIGLGLALVLVAFAGAGSSIDGFQLVKGVPLWARALTGATGLAVVALAVLAARNPVPELWTQHGFLGVPPRTPARLVTRPELTRTLVEALTGPASNVALTGIGGAGKSTLAAQACCDSRVQRRFRDGVTWLEASSGTDPLSLLADLGRRLGLPGTAVGFTSLTEGRDRLAAALRDKHVLIAVDNVWDTSPLDALTGLAPTCTVLFTTRVPGLAVTFGARQVQVDVLTPGQAVALLLKWTGGEAAAVSADARRLCARVGDLALGVAMVGAMVAQGRTVSGVLALVEEDLARVHADMEPAYPYRTLFAAIEASISSLPPEEARRYEQLAVFGRTGSFTRDAARVLWREEVSEARASDLLAEFAGRSLLTAAGDGRYVLHDAPGDVLALRLGAEGLAAAHARLVEGYRRRFPRWAESVRDPYASSALVGHLSRAGCAEEVKGLLLDYWWIAARLSAGELPSLLADYGYSEDPVCTAVSRALRLSAHALAADPGLARGQLAGRLLGNPDPQVAAWATGLAAEEGGGPWLMSLTPSLTPVTTALRQVLTGHKRWVLSVAVDPEGRTAVSGGTDGSVRVWDVRGGRRVMTLRGPRYSPVSALALTADAAVAVSGNQDGQLSVWELSSGELQATLPAHHGQVSSLAMGGHFAMLLSGGDDGLIKLWDLASRSEMAVLYGHAGAVASVALAADGAVAVSGGRDGQVLVWDVEQGVARGALTGHEGPVLACALDGSGELAVTGGSDGSVRLWDLTRMRQSAVLAGHAGGVLAAALSADGALAVTGGTDGSVRCWDLPAASAIRALVGHDGWVRSVSVSAAGVTAVTGGGDGSVRVWDVAAGSDVGMLSDDKGPVWAAAIAPETGVAVAGVGDGSVFAWDLGTDQEIAAVTREGGVSSSLAVTGDGDLAVSGDGDGRIRVWSVADGHERALLPGHGTWAWPVVALTADSKVAVSGGGDGLVRVWDVPGTAEIAALGGHSGGVSAVAVTPDGAVAVSGGEDGVIRVWDIPGRRGRAAQKTHKGSVQALTVTPDGAVAVSGGADNQVRVWDLTSGNEIHVLAGNQRQVNAVAVTEDGTIAVSGAEDGAVKIWNLQAGEEIAHWTGDYAVLACAVLPGSPLRIGVVQRRRKPYVLELREQR